MRKTSLLICIWAIFVFFNSASAITLPDTGQTKSYTSTFNEDYDNLIYPLSYTKSDSSYNQLQNSATSWAMVKDNNTELICESRTTDGSVNDWRIPTIYELIPIVILGEFL